MYVIQEDRNKFESLLVAPLSVLLEYRDHGVGSALMKEGLRRGREVGYKAAFLCGDPEYYHRFGFKSIREFGLTGSSYGSGKTDIVRQRRAIKCKAACLRKIDMPLYVFIIESILLIIIKKY